MLSGKSNKKGDFVDRRVFARLPVKLPLRFLEIGRNKESKAQTLNICANGVGFISKKRLSPDTPLEMWLEMSDQNEPLYIRGRVIWAKKLGGKTQEWRIGVVFERVNLIGLGRVYYRTTKQTEEK